MIVETLVFSVAEVRTDPVLRAIADPPRLDGSVLPRLTGPAGVTWASQALAPAIEAAGWREIEAGPRLERILRIFRSQIVNPEPRIGTRIGTIPGSGPGSGQFPYRFELVDITLLIGRSAIPAVE